MSLDLRHVFRTVNPILNSLVGKFDTMNLIGINQNGVRYYLAQGLTSFYYNIEGDTAEVRIVPDTIEEAHLKNIAAFEFRYADGRFERAVVQSFTAPDRPFYQYRFIVKPNNEDRSAIT